MKIVFDFNIYISAFLRPSGRAAIAFESAQKGHSLLFCSPDIVKEVDGKLRSKFLWEAMQIHNAVKRLVKASDKILQPQRKELPQLRLMIQTTTSWNAPERPKPISLSHRIIIFLIRSTSRESQSCAW